MKKTVIIGATTNQGRYAYLAAQMLSEYGHQIVPVGVKRGEVFGQEILNIYDRPAITDVDTVTMYIGPARQPEHIDYILSLKPKRIIFNPGTENEDFMKRAEKEGVEAMQACTLVLLRSRQF